MSRGRLPQRELPWSIRPWFIELLSRHRISVDDGGRVPLELCFRVRRTGRVLCGRSVRIERGAFTQVEGRVEVGESSLVRASERLHVHPGASMCIGRRCVVEAGARIIVFGQLELGDDVYVGRDVVLVAFESIVIGAGTLLGERVSVHDANHGPPEARQDFRTAPVLVGERAWLGAGTVVVAGAEVGRRTTVGANSTVTRPLPADVLAGGVPARVLKQLPQEDQFGPQGPDGSAGHDG
jgi:acetyltransferase-like isoleucine patch superfamily enzyme